jgi:hypothetical protein
VPQSYLGGFADGDRLRVFARVPNKSGARQFETSTVNVANERDLYTATTEFGRDTAFDDRLRSEIEDKIPETLAPLSVERQFSADERLAIVRLAVVQDARRPTSVQSLAETIERVQEIAAALYRQHVPGITEVEIQDRFRKPTASKAARRSAAWCERWARRCGAALVRSAAACDQQPLVAFQRCSYPRFSNQLFFG